MSINGRRELSVSTSALRTEMTVDNTVRGLADDYSFTDQNSSFDPFAAAASGHDDMDIGAHPDRQLMYRLVNAAAFKRLLEITADAAGERS